MLQGARLDTPHAVTLVRVAILVYGRSMRLPSAVFLCVVGIVCAQGPWVLPLAAQDVPADPLLTPNARCADVSGQPREPVELFSRPQATWPRRYPTYALLLFGLLAGFHAYDSVGGLRSVWRSRFGRSLLALLALAAVLAWLLPALPVHDHDAFVARAECAMDPNCDADRPGWMPPAYHGMGLLLSALPYRYPLLEYTGFALSLLTLLLLALSLARLHRLFGASPRGRAVALLTTAFLALNPVWLRLAVAGTFWPWADVCLAASLFFALFAAEHQKTSAWFASAAFFALALTSNVTFLALLPLVLLVPWAWTRRPPRPSALLPLGLVAVFVAPYAWGAVQRLGDAAASMPWSETLVSVPLNLVFVDPRLTPLPLIALFLLGIAVTLRRPRRMLPLLFAFAATEALLGSLQDLETGYPVRLIHGTTSLYFSAWLAGEGAFAAADWLRRRRSIPSRHTLLALLVATLLATPLCHEARAFAVGPRVLGPERRALSQVLDQLPDHDLLVVPPSIMSPLAGLRARHKIKWPSPSRATPPGCVARRSLAPASSLLAPCQAGVSAANLGHFIPCQALTWDGDPLEARYPWGEYRAVRKAHGGLTSIVVSLPNYLARREDFRGLRTLIYVGASLRSFAPAEVEAGFARPPFARPLLCDALAEYRLEPAATFVLPTANHPASLLRLTGDERVTATLGFFWLRPRAAELP